MEENKIKPVKWVWLYGVTGAIDAVQIGIDFIPYIGWILNEILDVVIGILLAFYFWRKGLLNMLATVEFVMAIFVKEGTVGIAPAWVIVVGFIHMQSKAKIAAVLTGGGATGKVGGAPANKPGVRMPNTQPPLNQGGKRLPQSKNPDQTTTPTAESTPTTSQTNNSPTSATLTTDKEQLERELGVLEPQLKALRDRYKADSVQYLKLKENVTEKRNEGASREEINSYEKIASDFLRSVSGNEDQMRRMQEDVDILKNKIWAKGNEIIEAMYREKKA